ncbi:Two-component response regulator [uncultured Candidatus Thioglobus sp.]|nr:Two-component response regulator [uncultured Candidatus Thioglobus sp.]
MPDNKHITVGLIGIANIEKKRLQVAFDYSSQRPQSYIINELDTLPDIIIVNADNYESIASWEIYRTGLAQHNVDNPPSLMLSKKRDLFVDGSSIIRRPLIISRVISILDKICEEVLIRNSDIAITDNVNVDIIENIILSANYADSPEDGAARPTQTKPVVLVVDDSLPVRVQMENALKKFVSRVDLAESGEDALELASTNDYALVFLDIILPGIDGYEICKTIKAGRCKNTPVILLTGNSSPADRIKGNLSGCDTYLIKPLNHVMFQEIVSQYLNTHATAS